MRCEECGAEPTYYADYGWGFKRTTLKDINHSKWAPKAIKVNLYHECTCTNYNTWADNHPATID